MMVIGSVQAVNILISILRQKVLAVMVGPAGVGLLSIFNSLHSVVTEAAGVGLSSSGVREIAAVREDQQTLRRVRWVLLSAHLGQGAMALLGVWLLREEISNWLFGDAAYSKEVGLLGVAVLLSLLASAHSALLQGLRLIGDLSRVTLTGALFGTVAGLAAVSIFGPDGLVWFIVVQPLGNLAAALYFVRKLARPAEARPKLRQFARIWLLMARIGLAFMLGKLATVISLLLIRGHVTKELGLDAAGYFAAATGVTVTYLGFLLSAMLADYYPRLTEVIKDRDAATSLMNDQAQLCLAIGGPLLLILIGTAPWIIALLYSTEFEPAVELLQWQALGNLFKIASFPLSISIVAAAHAKTFLATELFFNLIFVAVIYAFLPMAGLSITAMAFTLAYAVYFISVLAVARRIHGFRGNPITVRLFVIHIALSSALLALANLTPNIALISAPLLAIITGLLSVRVVLAQIGSGGRLATRLKNLFTRFGWPIQERS